MPPQSIRGLIGKEDNKVLLLGKINVEETWYIVGGTRYFDDGSEECEGKRKVWDGQPEI